MVCRKRCFDEHDQSKRIGHWLRAYRRQRRGTSDCHFGGDLHHERLPEYRLGCQRRGRGLVSRSDADAIRHIRRHGREPDAARRTVEVPKRLERYSHDLDGV